MTPVRALFAAVSALATLGAQSGPPRFEVASVRLHHTAECQGRWDFTAWHGAVNAQNAPLLRIVSRAFELTDDRVSGPSWMESACYDIRAKAPAGAPDRDLMPMLQSLLRERLHLVAQRESAERPVFALVADLDGPKLLPFGGKVEAPAGTEGKAFFAVRYVRDLCERLGKVAGRPVIDKTGLTGDYQIELYYLPFSSADGDAADSPFDIFAAVRNQLGLRLDPQRAPVETLKVVSADRTPTRN
jgi:uncharacterized protein (TIGR03435 family)